MAGSDVDDAETAMAQTNARVNEDAGIVRPAMPQHVAHAFELPDVKAASRVA